MKNKHKFFERYLDNDLESLSKFLLSQYEDIENNKLRGISEIQSDDAWIERLFTRRDQGFYER